MAITDTTSTREQAPARFVSPDTARPLLQQRHAQVLAGWQALAGYLEQDSELGLKRDVGHKFADGSVPIGIMQHDRRQGFIREAGAHLREIVGDLEAHGDRVLLAGSMFDLRYGSFIAVEPLLVGTSNRPAFGTIELVDRDFEDRISQANNDEWVDFFVRLNMESKPHQ